MEQIDRMQVVLREREQQLKTSDDLLQRWVDVSYVWEKLMNDLQSQLSEAREVLRLIEEYEPGTKGTTLLYIKERAVVLAEGARR